MIQDIERNYQYQLANGSGANATEATAFGQYPPTGGHKIVKANNELTEREKFEYYHQMEQRKQEAREFFESQGITTDYQHDR